MAFVKTEAINQGSGPYCGAACAMYVLHWLKNVGLKENTVDGKSADVQEEITHAMEQTRTVRCTNFFGSTPANIANYLKKHSPNVGIYAPTEIITNWSLRPWYTGLRLGLQTCCSVNWSCGCSCPMPGGILGDDYMIISLISKSLTVPFFSFDFYNGHFVVHIGGNNLMDPNGEIVDATTYLSGGYLSRGWASVGLDLHVYKKPATESTQLLP